MKYKIILLVFIVTCSLFFVSKSYSHMPFVPTCNLAFAAGVSGDVTVNKDQSDKGVYFSLNTGIIDFITILVNTDIGYELDKKAYKTRVGMSIYLDFWGIETGFIRNSVDNDEQFYKAHGAYFGLSRLFPLFDFMPVLSLGGEFYFYEQPITFYTKISFLFGTIY